MSSLTKKAFHYHKKEDALIMFKPVRELSYAYEDPVAIQIARHTANTWQKNRAFDEILENTVQGKIVEEMFEDYIFSKSETIQYVSYDAFRNDAYCKHAPIDGLLYQKGNEEVSAGIEKILRDVSASRYGKITEETFEWLRDHKIYTVEIKSSRVPDKDYPEKPFNSWEAQDMIVDNLRKRDFFVYPKYTRTAGGSIHDFEAYVDYVIANHPEVSSQNAMSPREFILQEERKGKCDIYTRIFIDKTHTENLIAYILGYTVRDRFFVDPRIINMPRPGKSEKALYYVYPIAASSQMDELFTDPRLW